MSFLQRPLTWFFKRRLAQLERATNRPLETQAALLKQLINKSKDTFFGRQFGFSSIKHTKDFQARVPIYSYEQLYPYIERVLKGEQQVLWSTPISWFAKSSGTTNAKSKLIPISSEALKEGHYKAGKDMLSIYINNYPDSQIVKGKSIAIGGSLCSNDFHPSSATYYGDVSAVLMKNLPFWAQWRRAPGLEIALMSQWEEKVEKLAKHTIEEDITSIAGVPTWVWSLFQKVLSIKGKQYIHDIWPSLELFIHGGITLDPYKKLFQAIAPQDLRYLEVYNASEGFFAVQDQIHASGMLLLLDHGIFYEFVPIDELDKDQPKAVSLEEVELGKIYALIISTNAGLWRYKIGDTVKFTSLAPFRIKIAGRTKQFINAFGEELIIENAEQAITRACQMTGAMLSDYTAGPNYIEEGKKGSHEWVIEFITPPNDLAHFTDILDTTLQELNSDYEAKRYKDLVLTQPIIRQVPRGTFYNWLKKQGRLGSQCKVPRLANDRQYVDDILAML